MIYVKNNTAEFRKGRKLGSKNKRYKPKKVLGVNSDRLKDISSYLKLGTGLSRETRGSINEIRSWIKILS